MKSRLLPQILLALLLVGFGLGVVALFQLRFNSGDIYPPYSSLRADPLGAKAFCESLQDIPGLSVSRFYEASSTKLGDGRQRSLFVLGIDRWRLDVMSEEDFKALQTFMFSGGRVVVSLLPEAAQEVAEPEKADHLPVKEHPARAHTNDVEAAEKTVSFLDKYGVRQENDRLFIPDAPASQAVLKKSPPATDGLPESISWHSAVFFTNMDANWRTIYERKKHALIVERRYGPGTLVLSADSYFVSNEALRRERHPALLAWLIGGSHDVLFDETHLGVSENPGVAQLMRRYNLEGVFLGLLLVAGLFVWQNSAPLVPPFPDEPGEGRMALVQGKESTAGLASLLRRSIPPAEILSVCFAEWKTACARAPRAAARLPDVEKIMEAEQARPPGSRRPAETWQAIQRILTARK